MRKRILLLILLFTQVSGVLKAQEKIDSIPPFDDSAFRNLSLVTDIGWTGYHQTTGTTIRNYDGINSKSINISLFQAFKIKDESILFKVGLGLALDGYKFTQPTDLISLQNNNYLFSDLQQIGEFRKSKFAVNYVGIPLELQIKNKWLYPMKFSLGFRTDLLFNAHFKQKWIAENGDVLKVKNRTGDYNLNNLRTSVYARYSISHVGFYGQYALSSLFKSSNGLQINPIVLGINYLID